jgi:hypothetical protein
MSKPLILILIIIGVLLIFLGIVSKIFLLVGLIIIIAVLFIGLGPEGILRKEQVYGSWATLIEKAQGKGEEALKDTEEFITASKAPDIVMERKEIAPSMVSGMIGKRREFLIIADRTFRLQAYKIYMSARDYGENLDVSWYLTFKPNIWQAIASLLPFVSVVHASLEDLDLFDLQDLSVFKTNAHQCMLKAVDKLMLGLGQDPNKIERKSRGFLGIS